jgi:hypothetical protein
MIKRPCYNSITWCVDSVMVLWCYIYNTHHNTLFLLRDSVLTQVITPIKTLKTL